MNFKENKLLQVLLYISSKTPIPDIYHVVKVLYFADKYHLSKFGSQVTSDSYIAMKDGPVASELYDLIKDVRDDRHMPMEKGELVKSSFRVDGLNVVPIVGPDLDYLSPAELESIDWAISEIGEMDFGTLRQLSHDSAWEKTVGESGLNQPIGVLDLAESLDAGEVVAEHVLDPNPGGEPVRRAG